MKNQGPIQFGGFAKIALSFFFWLPAFSPINSKGEEPDKETIFSPIEQKLREAEQSIGKAEEAMIKQSLMEAERESEAAGAETKPGGKIISYEQLPKSIQKKADAVYTVAFTKFFNRFKDGKEELWQTRVIAAGFLVEPAILVTAAHVAQILDQDLFEADISSLHRESKLKAKRLLTVSEKHGLALVEVEKLGQGGTAANLSLSGENIRKGDKIYGLCRRPNGFITAFESAVYAFYQNEMAFRFNKEPPFRGMSGAPIFNEEGEVVGVYKSVLYKGQKVYVHNEATKAAHLKKLLQEVKQPLESQGGAEKFENPSPAADKNYR